MSTMIAGVREQFNSVLHAKAAADTDDVAAGRRFVATYVPFIHSVERMFEAAATPARGHFPELAEEHLLELKKEH